MAAMERQVPNDATDVQAKRPGPRVRGKVVVVLALAIGAAALLWMRPGPAESAVAWQPFSKADIEQTASGGKVVLVKFSAGWCTYCQALDRQVYAKQAVADELAQRGVVPILADVTQNDSPAARMLAEDLREPGIPLTLIYGPGVEKPIRLRGVYTPEELYQALDTAAGTQ